jgi:hypothetical protein
MSELFTKSPSWKSRFISVDVYATIRPATCLTHQGCQEISYQKTTISSQSFKNKFLKEIQQQINLK